MRVKEWVALKYESERVSKSGDYLCETVSEALNLK